MIEPIVVVLTGNQRAGAPMSVILEQPVLANPIGADFDCTGTEPEFAAIAAVGAPPSAVRDAGELLFAGLSRNEDVRQAISSALLIGQGKRSPLIIDMRGVDAAIEALPWETVYAPETGFLGLDARWSIGRRVRSAEGQPTGVLAGPLRIATVLSCLGISAEREWKQLAAAVAAAPLPVEVLAFVGEPKLRNTLLAAPPPWARLEGIPDSATELADKLGLYRELGFVPHFLHFFCHGSLTDGPHLEIATTSDWQLDSPQSSLTLEAEEVVNLTKPTERPWLVVLNCCQGAAAAGGAGDTGAATHSLARNLLFQGGYPAVIGMREPIDAEDATSFSSRMYPELFAALAEQPPGQPVAPDWSRLLVTARRRLAEATGLSFSAAAQARRQWSLPVLYVRHQPNAAEFTVTREPPPPPINGALPPPPANDDMQAALLQRLLDVLGPDAPAALSAELAAHFAALPGRQP